MKTDLSSRLPVPATRCGTHAEPILLLCARCGGHQCSRCSPREGLCVRCAQRPRVLLRDTARELARRAPRLLDERAWAALVDLLCALVLWIPVMFLLWSPLSYLLPLPWGPLAALPLTLLAYHTLCEGFFGWTPGKLTRGLRVVDEQGRPPGPGRALRRNLARFVDAGLILPGALAVWRAPGGQRWGDRWAGTYVLRRADAETARGAPRVSLEDRP